VPVSPPRRSEADDTATRLLDAAAACISRVGVAKTTLDDVARSAGVARATLYRYYSGKPALLEALVARELETVRRRLAERAAAATDLTDTVVVLITAAAAEVQQHAALQFVLAHEPEVLLPHLTFDGCDHYLAAASEIAEPHLAPYLGAGAPRAGAWLARILASYLVSPSEHVEITDDESVRAFVSAFVLPGLLEQSRSAA
jgi:AcrR family transcriptional regulator